MYVKQQKGWRMSCDIGKATEGLENKLWCRWRDRKVGEWAESSSLSLHLRHNSFSNPSVALPTSQLILQPLHHFTYITTDSPTLLSLYLHHSSFWNLSITSPTSQLILQPFCCFTYITAHSPTLPLLHVCHSSFSKPFFRFSYVTSSLLNSPGEPPMEENIDSQDANIPMYHGHLAQNCLIKAIMQAVKALVISTKNLLK